MSNEFHTKLSKKAKFIGPAWGPPGSCRPQMGPMLAPWAFLSGMSALSGDLSTVDIVMAMLRSLIVNSSLTHISITRPRSGKLAYHAWSASYKHRQQQKKTSDKCHDHMLQLRLITCACNLIRIHHSCCVNGSTLLSHTWPNVKIWWTSALWNGYSHMSFI